MEYFNGKVKVFDDVLPEDVIHRWKTFYEQQLSFRRCAQETPDSPNIYFSRDIGYKENIEIFDYENTIVPHAQKVDINLRGSVKRSYINLFNHADKFDGHVDCDTIPEGKYFVSTVLFLNPLWEDQLNGGLQFTLEDETIRVPNVFNRLVCFNGNIHHCIEPFNSHRARVTHYMMFSDIKYPKSRISEQNKW